MSGHFWPATRSLSKALPRRANVFNSPNHNSNRKPITIDRTTPQPTLSKQDEAKQNNVLLGHSIGNSGRQHECRGAHSLLRPCCCQAKAAQHFSWCSAGFAASGADNWRDARGGNKNVMITKIMGHLLKKTNIGTRNTMYLPDSRCIYQTVLVSTADRLYLPAAHLVSTRDAPCIYQRRSLYLPAKNLGNSRKPTCIYQRRSLYLPETLLVSTRDAPCIYQVSTGIYCIYRARPGTTKT